MKYDKDIRTWPKLARIIVCAVCGAAVGVAAGKLLPASVAAAAALVTMIWALISLRQIIRMQKKLQDSQRLITATIHGRLEEKIGRLTGKIMGDEEDLQSDQARDASYGYSSYRCPKCGKVSHHPMDVEHKYCAACHGFERSDWRG